MKFYGRKKEIAALKDVERMSAESAQMTVMMGRRRVGKTTLLKHAFGQIPVLYFFVAKKNEVLLCDEFTGEVEDKLGISLGSFHGFSALFKAIMALSTEKNFTLIIDEFQEFLNLDKSVFGAMQNIWDTYKEHSHINLVVCGSIYPSMKKIFENAKEPLFGRATHKMTVRPFDIATIKKILSDNYPDYRPDDLLAFYMVTGGVAKYIEQLVQLKAFTKSRILDAIFTENSYFLNEGRDVLIEEFGKDYGNYFSILSLIASSKTERGDIENTLGMPVGGYLDKLEKEYDIIRKVRPFGAKVGSRSNRYMIVDIFLNLWFRFIYRYRSAVEIGDLEYVRDIVERDYDTFSGIVLVRYFNAKMIDDIEFSDIQRYWNKRGENGIDIVAVNEYARRIVFCEVKRNSQCISLPALEEKAKNIVKDFPKFTIEYKGLSLEDM